MSTKRTKTETLDLLWEVASDDIIARIQSGKATSADVANAIRFLKEGITDELKSAESNVDAKNEILKSIEDLPLDSIDIYKQ